MQSQGCTPEDDVDSKVLADGYSLDDPVGWVFDNKDGNVDTGGEPLVLQWEVSNAVPKRDVIVCGKHLLVDHADPSP